MAAPIDSSKVSLECIGDILTLTIGEQALKVKIPKGDRGAPGRDGVSIRGEQGLKGEPGLPGLPGRDSIVPGPQGPVGPPGQPAPLPVFSAGSVVSGEQASVVVSGSPDKPVLNFVIPRGFPGDRGPKGSDGKHGSHEYIQLYYAGHCPRFNNEWISAHVIADGVVELPEMAEEDVGKWTYIKTFDRIAVCGLVEDGVHIDKDGAKFVVISYAGKAKFSRF
jgi:hypothetical protein